MQPSPAAASALVFVPVFDQARELPGVLAEIDAAGLADVEFLLVDNGSTDGSERLVRESRHHVLRVPQNLGVGYSYMLAIDWALGRGHRVLATMASNGKMLPGELPRLLDPIRRDEADYVTGSRFLEGGASPNLPAFRRNAIPAVSVYASAIVGRRLTDATNGFRAFRLDLLARARFDWHARWLWTYGMEYYLYAKVLLEPSLRAIEVPSTMRYPSEGRYSKIRPGLDWLRMLQPWAVARVDGRGFAPSSEA